MARLVRKKVDDESARLIFVTSIETDIGFCVASKMRSNTSVVFPFAMWPQSFIVMQPLSVSSSTSLTMLACSLVDQSGECTNYNGCA